MNDPNITDWERKQHEADNGKRAGYITGLRALADILENHPGVPLPFDGSGTEMTISFLSDPDPRASLAAAARAFPVGWQKNAWESGEYGTAYFDLLGELHGLKIKLNAYRDAVCERVVTGTREVTEEVPDPEALAAVPKVTVTKIIEDVDWICGPVLVARKDEAAA